LGDLRSRHVGQPLNLAPVNGNACHFEQVLACRLITFPGSSPRRQANQGRGKPMNQAQGLIQRGAPQVGSLVVKVIAPQSDDAKNAFHLENAIGMALFTAMAGVFWNVQGRAIKQPFEQTASVLEQRLAQPQLNGFKVAHALAGKTFPHQPQERLRFPELFFLDFRRLEFFLASASPSAIWVI
jgi:hypothetical protein